MTNAEWTTRYIGALLITFVPPQLVLEKGEGAVV